MHIFADENAEERVFFNRVTLIYLNATSPVYRKKIINMDAILQPEEAVVMKSYLFDLYDEGIEKGIEKGKLEAMEHLVSAFIRNNPHASDATVSKNLDVSVDLVKKVRKKIDTKK